MPSAIKPLANITLGSAAASVTFSSITGNYRDLYLVVQFGHSVSGQGLRLRANSDTGTNYAYVEMYGDGSGTGSVSNAALSFIPLTAYGPLASTPIVSSLTSILDYSATDKHKTLLTRRDEAGYITEAITGRWASTSAITTLLIYPASGNIVAGSTFALYGVSA